MKIAHVVAHFPPDTGGMGQSCYEEVLRLSKKGHEVEVFTLKYLKTDYTNDQNYSFKVNRLKPVFRFGNAGWAIQLLFKLKNFDVIHLHYPFYGSAQCVYMASKFFKQKYVLTYHMDAQLSGAKKILQRIYDFIWAKKIFKNASQVLVADRTVFKDLKFSQYIGEQKIKEVPLAVDTEVFVPWPRELQEERIDKKNTILFVGNLIPLKRLDLLLEAYAESGIKNSLLLVVGGGYGVKKYKKMAEDLYLNDRIKFEGPCLESKKLSVYYNLADLVVVPSDYETFSLVTLESLACGTPVLASNIEALSNKITEGENGFLFEKGIKTDLIIQLKKFFALDESQKEIMGIKAHQSSEKFSWENHINMLEQIYERV